MKVVENENKHCLNVREISHIISTTTILDALAVQTFKVNVAGSYEHGRNVKCLYGSIAKYWHPSYNVELTTSNIFGGNVVFPVK